MVLSARRSFRERVTLRWFCTEEKLHTRFLERQRSQGSVPEHCVQEIYGATRSEGCPSTTSPLGQAYLCLSDTTVVAGKLCSYGFGSI